MEIKWLRLALKDLDEIYEYIAEDNITAASKTVNNIWNESIILKHHPESGREGRVPGTRELYIKNTHYIIPYRIKNSNVEILRVIHTSRNWPPFFKE